MSGHGSIALARRKISEEDKSRVIQVFCECDSGDKGHLEREDIKAAILSLFGYKPSKYEVDQLIGIGMRDCSPGLNLEKFQSMMFAKLSLEDLEQECRQIFNTFDIDCKGFLTRSDFRYAFQSVAPNLPESTIVSCFQHLDKDSDGRVSYKDFDSCLKYDPHG